MAKGYIIARVTVDDNAAYLEYAKRARVVMQEFGARILVLAGKHEALQGQARPRNIVLEFESYEQARGYYNSPGYQAAREFRTAEGVSVGEFLLVEGFDGPQPDESH